MTTRRLGGVYTRTTCFRHLSDGYAANYFYPAGIGNYGDAFGATMDDNGLWYTFLNPFAAPEGHLRAWTFPHLADTDPYSDKYDWASYNYHYWPCVEPDGSRIYSILNEVSIEAIDLPAGTSTILHTAAAGMLIGNLALVGSNLIFAESHDVPPSGFTDPAWVTELRYVTTSGASSGLLHSDSGPGYPRRPIFSTGFVTTRDGAVWGRIRQVDEIGFSHPVSFNLFRWDGSYTTVLDIGAGDIFSRRQNTVTWGVSTEYTADAALTITVDRCTDTIGAGTFSFAHDTTFTHVGLARFGPEEVWGLSP